MLGFLFRRRRRRRPTPEPIEPVATVNRVEAAEIAAKLALSAFLDTVPREKRLHAAERFILGAVDGYLDGPLHRSCQSVPLLRAHAETLLWRVRDRFRRRERPLRLSAVQLAHAGERPRPRPGRPQLVLIAAVREQDNAIG